MKKKARLLSGVVVLGLFLACLHLLTGGSTMETDFDPAPGPCIEAAEPGVREPGVRFLIKRENVRCPTISTTEVKRGASEMLEFIKEHLDEYYTAEDIYLACCMLQTEDWVAHSQTVWSAHIWTLVNRLNQPGFEQNDSLKGLLTAKDQFWVNDYSEIDPEIDWVVRDVLSRSVLEDMGYPEEDVGRTLPTEYRFFNKATNSDIYNAFYARCDSDGWGEPYDPFDAPFNPYEN